MNYPIGKGYFVWLLYRVAGGDPKRLAQMCKDAGLSWLALKVADGAYSFYANEYKKTVDLVEYVVNVTDDGVGLQGGTTTNVGRSFGLTIMRERAAKLNGQLSIESRPAGGTTVRLTFPAKQIGEAKP